MSKCSIYHKDTIHVAELGALLAKHPQPANHDQVHYVFASSYEGTERTSVPIDVDSLGLSGDELAWAIAQIITTDDNAVLELNVGTADALHKHPAWRIWCANYEDTEAGRVQFKEDWEYIANMVATFMPEAASLWPSYSESYSFVEGKAAILAAIKAFLNLEV